MSARLGTVAVPSREGDRVTTLELFFDLAFVFAFTQLSRLMAQQHDALGILQALVILALLWWAWTSYGWLTNIAHADRGVVRVAMIVGMTAMFVAGLVVLEAYDDLPGGLVGPLVFVGAYLVARVTHAIVFVWLAEPELRRRTLLTVTLSVVPSGALLIAGALLGGTWQLWCTIAAVAIEPLVSSRTSVGVAWPVRSTAHFTERHGLIVILALGESILGIGAGAATEPISVGILAGVILSMLICIALWWAYFTRLSGEAEHALLSVPAPSRGRTATTAYTYLHLLLVAGIVLAALGLEVAMAHIEDPDPLGLFGAAALSGGVACYLAGTAAFARRLLGTWNVPRLAIATIFVALTPALSALPPLAALASVVGVLIALFVSERSVTPAPAR
ncbi:low temperature requirement protein A [Herbiconiux sp. CPCC 203407]|uniref:Low temperature requirement protein A n=1 Tax=Herbiconiux oxytropis TaxID=2970915 RepID=A0AA42BU60_9MICO|nr:low temperature requirement protein A [Herbiconiux oxytropis]MCS5723460.1 low temperature requirement protein A [Herbiconiux oxytropis]MCS5726547.1 low temperature requirement protein A [Herbiconiux oxytropis]